MENRRRFHRHNCALEVEYYPKGNNIIYSQSVSKNISKGGICLPVLSRLVRTGDQITLDIYANGDKRSPIMLKGEVVWIKETSLLSHSNDSVLDAEAGIRFTDADDALVESLIQSATTTSGT